MKTFFKILVLIFVLHSCETKVKSVEIILDDTNILDSNIAGIVAENGRKDTFYFPQIHEIITDSLKIGNKGKNKLIAKVSEEVGNNRCRVINFYSKKGGNWILKNQYKFDANDPAGFNPKVIDYNNDGFKDLSFISGDAARGANEVRTLMIYSPKEDSLTWIKNSENFANLVFNDKLNCVDAWMFHGTTSQAFLKIKKDSLYEFASIELYENKFKVYEKENGVEKLVFEDSSYKYGDFVRFENYKPLIEYKEYPK